MDDADLVHLLRTQDGVVSRGQLRSLGAADHDLRRLVRRRELTRVHPGVFVDHTGHLSWDQRAWAAVLLHWPAALTRESALPGPSPSAPIQVAIDVRRSVLQVPGVRAHRTPDFAQRVSWIKCPPRVVLEHAAIDVAADSGDTAAVFRTLADLCQTRLTSADAIAETLRSRQRVRGRPLLRALLSDLATGACSVLERGYLHEVERAHGLPTGRRQAPTGAGAPPGLRDVEYAAYGVIIELDGRAFHDNASARDRDAERDLDALVGDRALTVRITYGQVFRSGCRTAARIAQLLRRGGWPGALTPCPACVDS